MRHLWLNDVVSKARSRRRSSAPRTRSREADGRDLSVRSRASLDRQADDPEVVKERLRLRYRLGQTVVWILGAVAVLLSLTVPLEPVRAMIESLSGKSTDVTVNAVVTVSIALTISLSAALVVTMRQNGKHRQELRRIREELEVLQEQIRHEPADRGSRSRGRGAGSS